MYRCYSESEGPPRASKPPACGGGGRAWTSRNDRSWERGRDRGVARRWLSVRAPDSSWTREGETHVHSGG